MKSERIIIALLIFLIAACNGQENNSAPVSEIPSAEFVLIPTSIIEPNLPLELTETPTSQEPLQTPSPTEKTFDVAKGDCLITPGFESVISPDGFWFASTCGVDGFMYLRVANVDGSEAWEFAFEDIVGGDIRYTYVNNYGDVRAFLPLLIAEHWFKDSRYLYVSTSYLIDGFYQDGFGLYRLDVQTGNIVPILPIGTGSPYSFSFSPNDEYYAYVTALESNVVHVVSLETGEDISYNVPGKIKLLQKLEWSPDTNKLAFINGYLFGEGETTSLLLLDLTTKSFSIFIEDDDMRLAPVEWISNDELILESWRNRWDKYIFNLGTKEIESYSTP